MNRRTFFVLPLALLTKEGLASNIVNPSDPTAKAIGYVENTSVAGLVCSNCIQAKDTGAAHIPCNLFPKQLVSRNGWCKVYVKK